MAVQKSPTVGSDSSRLGLSHEGAKIMAALYIGGVGYHVRELPTTYLVVLIKLLVVEQVLYGLTLGLVKCSICIVLIRIFIVRAFRVIALVVMSVCVAWTVMNVLVPLLICTPLSYNWDKDIPGGHCGNQKAVYMATGVSNIITEFMIFCLPLSMLWRLQIPMANKIGLLAVFGLGLATIILAILRTQNSATLDISDLTYSGGTSMLLIVLECGTAIIVSCAWFFRPFFEKIFPAALTAMRNRGRSSSSSREHNHQIGNKSSRHFTRLTGSQLALERLNEACSEPLSEDLRDGYKPGRTTAKLRDVGEIQHARNMRVQTQLDVDWHEGYGVH
ncbi:MAG: hypothetical protein M1816_005080 [Peltula sp. TS41687]|nr:MAG: hypothetical protein M1816_005080 [Peltula sp. TS41687]